ncbi:chemotaxis protein CheW [Ramlibacter tataouinensis]|uniref:chemotaxis protein CheW n=1 Tax=Ramlibacter tataouinensis TaxID=94132 RepID=UPI0022F39A21|nr:chemotaxis protein CheW [Ramlibacter tataouinensis]WBY00221.1 chemotaxis protein CheW [Ramlibacter tataouinensis]
MDAVASPRTPAPAGAAQQRRQYLTFQVNGEMFAMGIAAIKEIIEYRAPTDVPLMPAFMRGVINLRGRVVPVIDLSVRFGREPTVPTRRTCVVILELPHEGSTQDIGVLVDAVSAVLEIADADIEPPPSFGARLRSDFISGMGKVGERFAIILAIAHALSIEELASLDALSGAQQLPPPGGTGESE